MRCETKARAMNLFIGWKVEYKCEIANTYEISGLGVKRGEYISPEINLFELCLQRNNCDAARRFGGECPREWADGRGASSLGKRAESPIVGRENNKKIGTSGRKRSRVEKGKGEKERSTRSCAHCGRQVPLYRSTECNLQRILCTDMRQTTRSKRFILAHAVVPRMQDTLF